MLISAVAGERLPRGEGGNHLSIDSPRVSLYGRAAPGSSRIESFEEVGVLTRDAGFVLTADDGTEHQVTVVRSR